MNQNPNIHNVASQIKQKLSHNGAGKGAAKVLLHHLRLYRPVYIISFCNYPTSDRDPLPAHSPRCWTSCSENADIGGSGINEILFISEYLALEIYINFHCAPDRLSAPVEGEPEKAPKLFILFYQYITLCPPSSVFSPQGAQATELTHMYTPSGKLLTILMDSHDGSSRNHPVVTYTGPIQREGKIYLQRKTGNKVEMDIEVDPLYRRPKSIETKLSDGHIELKLSYQYDKKGNITKITNHFHEDRNQEFEYDAVNRITRAKGKYGEETYSYHRNGNLLKRGQFSLQYNNPNHIHAVTRADSPQTGLIDYQYDSAGNLIQRNGDIYQYNAMGKLQEITTEGGDKFTYTYDHSGNRIKKHLQNANTTTYSCRRRMTDDRGQS